MSIEEEIRRLQKIKKIYEAIDELTEDIIRKTGVEIPLKDIDYLISLFGGTIVEGDSFKKPEKTSTNTFNIFVSPWDRPQSRKFYAAARLGDVLLHTNYLSNHEEYLNSKEMEYKPDNGLLQQVYLSNDFAGSLLMPKNTFFDVVDNFSEDGMVDCRKVADHFDVSVSSAIARGKRLGYKWE